jgi:hypothetical protein
MDFLTDLINAAWLMLDNGFDPHAFLTWKEVALVCLIGLLGPFHFYTQNFRRLTAEPGPRGLLAGDGVLEAVKSEISVRPVDVPPNACRVTVNDQWCHNKLRSLLACFPGTKAIQCRARDA